MYAFTNINNDLYALKIIKTSFRETKQINKKNIKIGLYNKRSIKLVSLYCKLCTYYHSYACRYTHAILCKRHTLS